MALTLSQAEAEVRTLTRHKQDTRVESADIWLYLNRACRALRAELREIAPEWYLDTSDEIVVADAEEIVLEDPDVNFDNIFLVERKDDNGVWRPIERAATLDPTYSVHGGITFAVEHKCLVLYAPYGVSTAGTYRVKHWNYPANLTDANSYFQIPHQLEQALIYRACGLVHLQDGDGPAGKKAFDDLADEVIKKAIPSLKNRHGVHPGTAGLRRVMGR